MSIVDIDSFELYPDAASLEGRYTSPNFKLSATGGRQGSQCLYGTSYDHKVSIPVPQAHTIVGIWFKPGGGPEHFPAVTSYLSLHSVDLRIAESNFELFLNINGTDDFTGKIFSKDVWYFLELGVDPSSNRVRLWMDGENLIDRSDVSVSAASDLVIRAGNVAANDECWYDNLYIIDASDGTGAVDALGPVRMGVQQPNADTTDADFTPQGGGANHDEVDEVPDDGDATYVESGTVGHRDRYELDALGFVPDEILAAQVVPIAKDAAGGGGTMKALIEQNGSEASGSSVVLPSSYEHTARAVFETNPDTGAAWTQAELEDATAGQEVT